MKMVKSLLLGSAAGLVAVAGAQAADLPVKAKPVEYVKICSLYGAGFYYIPGTDICLKIGGYVRAEYGLDVQRRSTLHVYGSANAQDRTTSTATSARSRLHHGRRRTQTDYGTLRTYIAVGVEQRASAARSRSTFSANRAFIQWAGFTFGHAQSFFDFYSVPATSYCGFVSGL